MNPTVGDIAGNEQKIADGIDAALRAEAQLALFPELAITGWDPARRFAYRSLRSPATRPRIYC